METTHECKCCGKAFQPTCHASRQIYCSEACRIKTNNAKRYAPPENACMECGASLEQNRQQGRNRKFCGDACRKANHTKAMAEKKRAERQTLRVCPNCGREFLPMWEKGALPRFCGDECRIAWWREYHKLTSGSEEMKTACAYCGREMCGREGKYCSRACYRLGAAQVRGERRCDRCGKILPKKARVGQKYCCPSCAAAAWKLRNRTGPKRRCITARNPQAWHRQLAELTRRAEAEPQKGKRILLVCNVMKLVSIDALINFIRYELQCDPFGGNLYVFCTNEGAQLKWVQWDGSGFCIGSRYAEWGKYPWPIDKQGAVMEITEQEYKFLRSKTTLGNEEETR